MRKSGAPSLASVITTAFVQREVPSHLVGRDGASIAPPNRGKPPAQASWTLRTHIELDDIDGLGARGARLCKVIGQVNGYPLELFAKHVGAEDGDDDDHLGLFVFVRYPYSTSAGRDADPERAVASGLDRGVALDVTIRITGWDDESALFEYFVTEGSSYGFPKAIPWSQAAHGSPYFPNGRCEIELTVKMARA